MKIKIKCYVKEVKTAKSVFITRYTFISVVKPDQTGNEDVLFSIKFTKDVPIDVVPNVSAILICDDKNVTLNLNKKQIWITGIEELIPMERPVTDLSQYFEVIDET